MSVSTNQQLVRRLFEEAWNRGDERVLDELLASSDHTIRSHLSPDSLHIGANIRMLRAAFPDWRVMIEMMIGMPDRVLTQWRACGTHLGSFMGLPPTGRCVTASGTSIFYIVNGRIQDARVSRDSLSMLKQVCIALTSDPAQLWPDAAPTTGCATDGDGLAELEVGGGLRHRRN